MAMELFGRKFKRWHWLTLGSVFFACLVIVVVQAGLTYRVVFDDYVWNSGLRAEHPLNRFPELIGYRAKIRNVILPAQQTTGRTEYYIYANRLPHVCLFYYGVNGDRERALMAMNAPPINWLRKELIYDVHYDDIVGFIGVHEMTHCSQPVDFQTETDFMFYRNEIRADVAAALWALSENRGLLVRFMADIRAGGYLTDPKHNSSVALYALLDEHNHQDKDQNWGELADKWLAGHAEVFISGHELARRIAFGRHGDQYRDMTNTVAGLTCVFAVHNMINPEDSMLSIANITSNVCHVPGITKALDVNENSVAIERYVKP